MMKQYYLDKINKCEKKISFFEELIKMKTIKKIARIAATEEKNGIQHYYLFGHGIKIDTKKGLVLEVK